MAKLNVGNRFETSSTLEKLGELPITSFQGSSCELLLHPVPGQTRNLKNINKTSIKQPSKQETTCQWPSMKLSKSFSFSFVILCSAQLPHVLLEVLHHTSTVEFKLSYLRILANIRSLLGSSARSLFANSQQSVNAEMHFSLRRIRRALSLQVSLTGYAFTPAMQHL